MLLLYGIFSIIKMNKYYIKGKVIKGIVKDVIFNDGVYFPVIEYYNKEISEKSIIFESNVGDRLFNFEIGSIVELLYYKDKNKSKLFIKSWKNNFSFRITCIVLGLISIAYGFIQW
ncbi:hypothetical protein [uncultured Clostridium sp.]|uniref:hypothetical protein n=1 Tax=uncultured Clostridium sp. TaxID=59620 RepID=UPI0028F0FD44|nr:hypothetical protein [uncultured Clostridium sp.]